MAANDYYNPSGGAHQQRYDTYDTYEPSIAPSTKPPTYVSRQNTHTHPNNNPAAGAGALGPSPFETDFDDHVYPANSHPSSGPASTMGSSAHNLGHDTGYHGATPGNVSPLGPDDIPLRDHAKPYGTAPGPMDSNDHVYDAPEQGAVGARGMGKKGKIRFGELGMLGADRQKIPFLVYLFTVIQIAVFIGELVKASQLTGSAIQTSPTFNPMIGPSQPVLINMGARYEPCMHNTRGIQDFTTAFTFQCPSSTSIDVNDPNNKCDLSQVCGFGGVPNPEFKVPPGLGQSPYPNQWYRFIIPIFLHAGFIHIGFNLLLQIVVGREIEKSIGSIRFFVVYMFAGIFGNVMGANYAGSAVASTGASGSLFGIIAILLLDLIYSWNERRNPGRELVFTIVQIIVSLALGLLPGLDNFCHIGGFIVGICLGVSVLHSPNALRRRIGDDHFTGPSYSNLHNAQGISSVAFPAFYRNPIGFFKGRKPLWWAWWLVRAGFLVLIIVAFIVLLNDFYSNNSNCEWCKYLSCLPVNGWCDNINIKATTS